MSVLYLPLLLGLSTSPAAAHGGGLDASGCHHDRQRGGYHCHRGGYTRSTYRAPRRSYHPPPRLAPAVPQGIRDGCRYTVARGDTVAVIAREYGLTTTQLASWNHLDDPDIIEVGAELFLTSACAHEVLRAYSPVSNPIIAPAPTATPVAVQPRPPAMRPPPPPPPPPPPRLLTIHLTDRNGTELDPVSILDHRGHLLGRTGSPIMRHDDVLGYRIGSRSIPAASVVTDSYRIEMEPLRSGDLPDSSLSAVRVPQSAMWRLHGHGALSPLSPEGLLTQYGRNGGPFAAEIWVGGNLPSTPFQGGEAWPDARVGEVCVKLDGPGEHTIAQGLDAGWDSPPTPPAKRARCGGLAPAVLLSVTGGGVGGASYMALNQLSLPNTPEWALPVALGSVGLTTGIAAAICMGKHVPKPERKAYKASRTEHEALMTTSVRFAPLEECSAF